jgi:hypothetical protein
MFVRMFVRLSVRCLPVAASRKHGQHRARCPTRAAAGTRAGAPQRRAASVELGTRREPSQQSRESAEVNCKQCHRLQALPINEHRGSTAVPELTHWQVHRPSHFRLAAYCSEQNFF